MIRSRSTAAGAIALAAGVTVSTTLPASVVGVLGASMGADLGFGAAVLGLLAAVYWAASSVVSLLGGGVVARWNPATTMVVATVAAMVSLVGTSVLSPVWGLLLVWAALGGAANAMGHPSSNSLLRSRLPTHRSALGFGVKQAAVPLASIVTGASLPLLLTTNGWRWALAPAVGLAVVVAAAALHRRGTAGSRSTKGAEPALDRDTRRYLQTISVSTFFAAGHANSMGVFVVTAALARGVDLATAGALVVVSSVVAAVVRALTGVLADRGIGGSLRTVAALLVLGAVGLVAMATPSATIFIIGCLLAFTGSYGWPGLVHHVTATSVPQATGRATLITQSGSYLGSTVGPLAFGLAFAQWGTSWPWALMAATAVLAAACALLARAPSVSFPQ